MFKSFVIFGQPKRRQYCIIRILHHFQSISICLNPHRMGKSCECRQKEPILDHFQKFMIETPMVTCIRHLTHVRIDAQELKLKRFYGTDNAHSIGNIFHFYKSLLVQSNPNEKGIIFRSLNMMEYSSVRLNTSGRRHWQYAQAAVAADGGGDVCCVPKKVRTHFLVTAPKSHKNCKLLPIVNIFNSICFVCRFNLDIARVCWSSPFNLGVVIFLSLLWLAVKLFSDLECVQWVWNAVCAVTYAN